MQKKIIALAVAGLASTAAFAQSNVTVYGVVDMYAANVGDGSNGTTASVLNSGGLSGSRLGFKGTEDLGNGTKAIFTLEYALGVDTAESTIKDYDDISGTNTDTVGSYHNRGNGSGIGQARQAFVGLTGAYGTAIAGRLQTLVYNHNAAYNPTFGTGVDTLASVAANGSAAIGTAERLDNAIAYVAPKMGDVTLAAAYTNNAGGTDVGQFSTMTRAYELSATYASGPLSVGGVYRNVIDTAAVASNGNNSYAIGASYDVGVAKLMATFGKQQANRDSSNQNKVNLYNLGAVVPVSAAGAVILSYGNSQLDAAGVAADTTRTTYAALYKHNLSKRTALYGGWAKSTGADGGTGSLAGVTSAADASVSVALAGINHSF